MRRHVFAFAITGCAALFILLTGFWASALVPACGYDRMAVQAGQWWRLATAQWVHLSPWHGALNAAALSLVVWLGVGRLRWWEWLALFVGSVAAVDAGLYWLSPAVEWYVGASGALHGVFAGIGVILAVRHREKFGLAMLALLMAKLAYEQLAHGAMPWIAASVPVVTIAHIYGATGGALTAAATLLPTVSRRLKF